MEPCETNNSLYPWTKNWVKFYSLVSIWKQLFISLRQSNALERSISIVPTTPDFSKQFYQLNWRLDKACCVQYLQQNSHEERVLFRRTNLVACVIFFHRLWIVIVRSLSVGNFFCLQDHFSYKGPLTNRKLHSRRQSDIRGRGSIMVGRLFAICKHIDIYKK